MQIVTVIPLKKSANKGDLTYFTSQDTKVGDIVTVPLRSKKILAIVVGVEDARGAKSDIKEMDFNLRKVLEVKGRAIWRQEYLESILDMTNYFVTTKNNAMSTFLPATFQDAYDKIAEFVPTADNSPKVLKKDIRADKLLLQATPEDRISSYKTLIRESFALKKSVFIVLPTEREVKNSYEILSKGVEQFSFYLHSGISKKKLLGKFEKIMKTEHGVLIVGTAQFLSIPRQDVGIIIVEHESANSYRTILRPHFDLRTFIEVFTAKIGARLILADTLLRYETIGRTDIDGLSPLQPLSFRTNFTGAIEIENPREKKEREFRIFSDQNMQDMQNVTAKKKNVFIFSLRKGLATMTVCKDCNEVVSCARCGAPLVLHVSEGGKRMFVCNRCQTLRTGDTICSYCGSWSLVPLGIGTDTVYEELKKALPKIKIFKLDKESARNAKGAAEIIENFENNPGSILIGTEMALFYLNNEIPLSIVASFDSLWSIPNFKMSEKIIQLMTSILRITRDKLVILTKNKRDSAVLAVESTNLLSFIRDELADRKSLNYPPYKRFIKITHLGSKEETLTARAELKEMFKEYEPDIFSGFVGKLRDRYTTNALIKMDTANWSLPEISTGSHIDTALYEKLSVLPKNFGVFVDPEDLL